jgi:large subunit ribosomal protein L24
MKKIKKGDEVVIIAGKDRGKQGKVLSVHQDHVTVEGANQVKKCVRPNPQKGEQGGIIEKTMPLHCSNVMLYDPNKQKGSRVGIRKLQDGELVRYFKTSNELVDTKR